MAVPITYRLLGYRPQGSDDVTHLSDIRGNDGRLSHAIQKIVEPSREECTAGLGEVQSTDSSQLDGKTLQQNSKQIAHEDNEQEPEAIRSSSGNIGSIIAGINYLYLVSIDEGNTYEEKVDRRQSTSVAEEGFGAPRGGFAYCKLPTREIRVR